MILKIATWNINSVRLRIGSIKRLVEQENIDILCLQETKAADEVFPANDLRSFGFPHLAFRGEKSYNGVAILSKIPIELLGGENFGGREDKRHIAVKLPDGTELHNFYVPAGGDIPDPAQNPSFAFKLAFVDHMKEWGKTHLSASKPAILVGDLNIAPLPNDVWSHKQLLDVVSHTPVEVEKLTQLQQSLNWRDAARRFVPDDQKLYSWWSYRARDWEASNRGRRLDHIWHTAPLDNRLVNTYIRKEPRGWDKPSDHVPVVAEFEMAA